MNDPLLIRTEAYVTQLFETSPQPAFPYHSLRHTLRVVEVSNQLADHYQLSGDDHQSVLLAAWFHDVGHLLGPTATHEEKGVAVAARFLADNQVPTAQIETVSGCILATKMPQSPTTLLQQILCDADLAHLGSDDFKEITKLLRQENEQLTGQSVSKSEWRTVNIDFLQKHQYFTDYARALLDAGKARNLHRLEEKTAEKEPVPAEVVQAARTDEPPRVQKKDKPEKKAKADKPDRGIETMFRTTSSNHLRLSEIADSKANIMISVNSIMISVVVSVLAHRLEENPHLILPTALFLLTALTTIIFSILATRPNVTRGTFSSEDIQNQKANLLFFGNFYNMSLQEYETGISAMMKDSDFLYGSMTRDIYYLGVVLGRKYKLLRFAYNIFMFGFIVSVLAFFVAFLLAAK